MHSHIKNSDLILMFEFLKLVMLIVVVKITTSARSRHLKNLTDHGGFRFDLIQLILPNHQANRTVTTTRHVVDNNCGFKPLASPTSAIPEDHAPRDQLQLGRYGQLWL